MEEKIYQRCVVKLAVAGTVVDKLHLDRHYNSNDLRQMYQFDYSQFAERPELNRPNDTLLALLIEQHIDIYSYLEHNSLLENKPDEELDDEDKKLAWEDFIKAKNNKTEKPTGMITFTTIFDLINVFFCFENFIVSHPKWWLTIFFSCSTVIVSIIP